MSRKMWNIIPYDKNVASALAQKCGADDFAVLLLISRGVDTPEKIKEFLSASSGTLSSPFLLKDMEKATDRIKRAVENGEKIHIFGDYDADGVTSTALLFSYLETLGARVSRRIPSRLKDGYGLSLEASKLMANEGVELVITVDNGITSFEEAEFFKDKGIDFIITDHHRAGEKLPNAYAVINPQRTDDSSPEKNLAGVGVVLKLVAALENGDYDLLFEEYGDLAAIGTIADIMPLTNENRIIAARGLKTLENTCRPGLAALIKSVGFTKGITSSSVAFGIAPRINAAGRMGSADTSLNLLLTENEEEAEELAKSVNDANSLRKNVEAEIIKEIEDYFDKNPSYRNERILIAVGKNWHKGVIGIAASKLVDKYGKPAIIISSDKDNISRGSGRSIEGFSLYEALSFCSDVLLQFGGHTLAAGLSLKEENIEVFRKKINEYAATLPPFYPMLNIDCRLNPANISTEILSSLSILEPCGAANPVPVFGLFNMKILSIIPVGSNRHLRLVFTKNSVSITAVFFGKTPEDFPYVQGDKVDIAAKIEKNEYMGKTDVSIRIKDIRPAGTDDGQLFPLIDRYSRFIRGEKLDEEEKKSICPDRGLLSEIYRYIRTNRSWRFSAETLCMKIKRSPSYTGAVMTSLTALTKLGILTKNNGEYTVPPFDGKAVLANCDILASLGYKE